MHTTEPVSVVIAGLGDRGFDIYARYQSLAPTEFKITAIADPDTSKLQRAAELFGIEKDFCFKTAEELFASKKLADAAIIATQDRQHVAHATAALERGYHVLCEKPISPSAKECIELAQTAHQAARIVAVGHVLRYAPFYAQLKALIDQGKIGKIQRIQAAEHVGYYHQAHSFVRGNWRRKDETSPMILAKCCHDLDLFIWLIGDKCERVSSFGSLNYFQAPNAPAGAGKRCLVDCMPKVKKDCPYDAEKIYLTSPKTGVLALQKRGVTEDRCWPASIVSPGDVTENAIRQQLQSGPYGRCVFYCDNDVVDRQVVNLEFAQGVTVNFEMTAFSAEVERTIHLSGTHGEIRGNMERNELVYTRYGQNPQRINLKENNLAGHGGGDNRLIADFVQAVKAARESEKSDGKFLAQQLRTGIDQSIQSHLVALASEESRVNNGKPVEMSEFIARLK